jgi:DNA primase
MADTQEIYTRLLARGYQEQLFSDLQGKKEEGYDVRASCPFCHGHNFSYSSREPVWRCFNCDKGGDWIAYLMDRQRLSFPEALQELAQAAGMEMEGYDQAKHQAYVKRASLLEAAQDLLQQALWEPAGRPVLQYLQDRGYTQEEIKAMALGAYISRKGLQEQLQKAGYSEEEIKASGLLTKGLGDSHQLSLAWRDPSGRATGLAVRAIQPGTEPKYLYSAGLAKSQGLIGLEAIRGERMAILLEGVLDALYLNSKGLKAVAIGGTDLSLAQIKALEANSTKELILALDADDPGQAGIEKAIRLLRPSKIRAYVLSLPEGYKDPDELVRAKGPEALKQALRKSQVASSWMARRIIGRHDLQDPMGQDRGLEEALETYAQIEDAIDARAFWESLRKATGLTEEELEGRAGQASQALSAKKSREALQRLQNKLRDKISEGDIIGAELALSHGLQEIQRSRGISLPEPVLLTDAIASIKTTPEAYKTGWASLDREIGFEAGAVSLIVGRTRHGKTAMLLNLFLHHVRQYPDRRMHFFSYEESTDSLWIKLLMIASGVSLQKEESTQNFRAFRHYLKEKRDRKDERNEKIEKAIAELQGYAVSGRLTLISKPYPVDDLASMLDILGRREDTGPVFVDYIQRIPPAQAGDVRYLQLKDVSGRLLDQAIDHKLALIMGAQFGRSVNTREAVRLDAIREAGDLEQDANTVLGLWNHGAKDDPANDRQSQGSKELLDAKILKNRFGSNGQWISLSFDGPTLRIEELSSRWS